MADYWVAFRIKDERRCGRASSARLQALKAVLESHGTGFWHGDTDLVALRTGVTIDALTRALKGAIDRAPTGWSWGRSEGPARATSAIRGRDFSPSSGPQSGSDAGTRRAPPDGAGTKTESRGFYRQGKAMRSQEMASKRELIDTGNDKRFVRRDEKGRFKDVVDVGRSLAADRRQQAKTKTKPGQGDRGDR
ncbi:MAG: hypothetical protein M3177_07890 [Pseudomonadota bacterium]|nr:hypothetical protein [Pseudomonadota bacterium]